MFLGSATDPTAWTIEDEYQLGDDILVAPVLHPAETSRRVYLSTGTWRDCWTGATYPGHQWLQAPAPIGHIPLFTREGSDPGLPDPTTLWTPPDPML